MKKWNKFNKYKINLFDDVRSNIIKYGYNETDVIFCIITRYWWREDVLKVFKFSLETFKTISNTTYYDHDVDLSLKFVFYDNMYLCRITDGDIYWWGLKEQTYSTKYCYYINSTNISLKEYYDYYKIHDDISIKLKNFE